MSSRETVHNLDLKNYSLDELLDLFQLDYNMTTYDLNRARKTVLMLHPDKSKLPPEYFIFYKRAFEKIVELYEDLTKHNRPITKESTIYNAEISERNTDNQYVKMPSIDKNLQKKIVAPEFNKKFNEMFERAHQTRPDESRNDWFRDESSEFDSLPTVTTRENMANAIETLREKTSTNALVNYRGFEEVLPSLGTTLYEDGESQKYVSAPLFKGKNLVFDDIRKVHKDETIIPVKYVNAPSRTMTVDQYVASRSVNDELPLAKDEAERILAEKMINQRNEILKKQYAAKIQDSENYTKSMKEMSYFFRLENGAAK